MTFDERVTDIEPHGFTDRQSRFLVTVMLHSGVCMVRQYCAFSNIVRGQKTQNFFWSLVARNYATVSSTRTGRSGCFTCSIEGSTRRSASRTPAIGSPRRWVDFATLIWPPLMPKFGPPSTLTDPCRSPRGSRRVGWTGEPEWSYSQRFGGSISSASAPSRECLGSWVYIDGSCGRRWPMPCRRRGVTGAREADLGPGADVHRSDFGGRPDGPPQAAAHGAPHLRSTLS